MGHRSSGGVPIPGAAHEILKQHGAPMHVKAITDEMIRRGDRKNSDHKKLYYAVYAALRDLSRKGRMFEKVSPSTYGLLTSGPAADEASARETTDIEPASKRAGADPI